MKGLKLKRWDPFLIVIALLAGFLNIYGIWKDQSANAYYTAAVTSMLQSFHNFFFASFDPGGFVTVDKPPVAFWVQTLFASIFGVHGWSVILPQALAGVGSVILVYILVKPTFGKTAARLSALVMACTPIAAAVSRTNNVDSLLVFTLLAATWLLFKAVKTKKWPWFLAAFGLIGVGFNIKMLQAFMVFPAFYLFYWLAYKANLKKKLTVLAGSTAVLLILSFSWAVVVDSIPADNRPYIGSSQTNSVLELAFGYNGLSRLTGQRGAGGGNRPGDGNQAFNQPGSNQMFEQGSDDGSRMRPDDSNQFPSGFSPGQDGNSRTLPGDDGRNRAGNPNDGGGGPGNGGMFNTGTPGPFRLFQSQLSGQISWLLPIALLGALGLLLGLRRKKAMTDKQKETLFWLAWLLPMMGFFSVAGFFHQYYLVMLAPAIAALTGAGWTELYGFTRNCDGWKGWLLPAGILGTTLFQVYILLPYKAQIGLALPVIVGVLGIGAALYLGITQIKGLVKLVWGNSRKVAASGAILVLLMAPLFWAATPLLYGGNSTLPAAGPESSGRGMPGQGAGPSQGQDPGNGNVSFSRQENINSALINYLTANNTGEKYLFATTNAGTAEAYIIQTGQAVMAMGGFSGNDPILTVDKLKEMVANHEVKYFLTSGGGFGGGSSEVQTWIRENGREVPQEEWQSGTEASAERGTDRNGSVTLYEVTLD
ncbi:PMT family glycosyltransferase, 4-amino-4-deoxy-L-arabinose transferase [Desulfosporosinus orientis DSM 765]|uniref:PMT family glycosyltransferase, 4-amino-4-deoxy-L-arabinose transferase n=1 Tax=Desulfosporosinus orientis (strain ATCC 19365 / DSM 765 / NCIMB 8382 / VKM B-1628 / Singapore I) TaxID=768706 RepID=G7WIL2_DESOD|nr:glycosyltransferase family 39 protein [Desulfosporosinus orientis]AET69086.1 PMT family glycosyltransferase, 4-amino-4-deoxy-L-arabinose transferase [Desulfosporosinus orientis DSM 765]